MLRKTLMIGAASALALPGMALAAVITYEADLTALNDSGVEGQAVFVHDTDANTLTVQVAATGVEPNQVHPQHIHGRFNPANNPIESNIPVPEAEFDTDGDGFVEVGEGAPAYGPVILPLTPFPEPPDSTITFEQTYDLTDPSILNPDIGFDLSVDDLFPLSQKVYVLHGMTVPGFVDDDPETGEATMTYLASLPIAAGEIRQVGDGATEVPEPATLALLGAGLAGLGLAARRKRR